MRKIYFLLAILVFNITNAQVSVSPKTPTNNTPGLDETLSIEGKVRVDGLHNFDIQDAPLVYDLDKKILAKGKTPMYKINYKVKLPDDGIRPTRLYTLQTNIPTDKYSIFITSADLRRVSDDKIVVMGHTGNEEKNGVNTVRPIILDGKWNIWADHGAVLDPFYTGSCEETWPEVYMHYPEGLYQPLPNQGQIYWDLKVLVVRNEYLYHLGLHRNYFLKYYYPKQDKLCPADQGGRSPKTPLDESGRVINPDDKDPTLMPVPLKLNIK